MKNTKAAAFLPFILTAIVVAADQLTKYIITQTVERNQEIIHVIGSFFRIIHVRNTGIAFSMGNNLPGELRALFFTLLPLAVIGILLYFYFTSDEIAGAGRWAIAGILGGGIGNLIDRIIRPDGVVDFLDVKFFGLFGLERWPTFNIADSAVVVCGILLIIYMIIKDIQIYKEQKLRKEEAENHQSETSEE